MAIVSDDLSLPAQHPRHPAMREGSIMDGAGLGIQKEQAILTAASGLLSLGLWAIAPDLENEDGVIAVYSHPELCACGVEGGFGRVLGRS